MENSFENNFANPEIELDKFYSNSLLVNGDPNFENLFPSTNQDNNTDDPKKSLSAQLQNNDKMFDDKITNLQGTYNDPTYNNRMFGFNPSFKGLNMDRYDDADLGFDPFRDNEKFYNDNTSLAYDATRALGGFFRIGASAFADTATSLGRMIQGDFDISKEAALDSERIMAETMSTKSGVIPGVSNFLVNFGFTAGVLTELWAEEMLIATIAGLTSVPSGGASLGAGGILAAARAGMASTKIVSMAKNMGNLAKALSHLDDVNAARQYFTSFGKGTLQFINPLQSTTNLFIGANQLKGLNQMAAASKGFGAFFRDVRDINRSLSEARLEGGFVYNKMYEDLVNEHYDRTGQAPSEGELNAIKNNALTAGRTDMLINLPVIHYTNNIVFGNLGKTAGKLLGATEDTLKILGTKIGLVDDVWQELEKSYKASLRRNLNPRNIAKNSLTYFSKNLAEGLQESFQEATAVATEDYYKNLFFNERQASKKQVELSWLDSYGLGIAEQFSAQGAEVFASGFFMGGLTNTIVKGINKSANYINQVTSDTYKQWKASGTSEKAKAFAAEYAQEKEQKLKKEEEVKKLKNDLIESLNTLYQKDAAKLFTPDLENMTAQEILAEKMRVSKINGDNKFLIDFADESFFRHVTYTLQSGKYDSFLERLETGLKLNDDELAQSMGVPDGSVARARLEVALDRAKEIKNRMDKAPKNPVDLSMYKRGTPEYQQAIILNKAFEDAKHSMVFTSHKFDRTLKRMRSITDDFASIEIFGNSSASPLLHLLGYDKLKEEVKLLTSEIQQLEQGSAEDKALANQKKKLITKLNNLEETISDFQKYTSEVEYNKAMEDIAEIDPLGDKIKIAFKDYVQEYSKINASVVKSEELDKAFELLFDYYRLFGDLDVLSNAVAIMSTPEFIAQEGARRGAILQKMYDNKKEYIKKSVDGFFKMIHLNKVFEKLQKIGVAIDPKEAIEFNINPNKYTISRFINSKDMSFITSSDPKMEQIREIMDEYETVTGIKAEKEAERIKAEEEKKKREEEEAAKKEAEEEAAAAATEQGDYDFDENTLEQLEDAYSKYPRKDEETFEEFLDSPQAQRIINASKRGKEPEEAPSSTLGFEKLGDIGNQGLAIMETEINKTGKFVLPNISKATPEQRQKIDANIEELKKKYPEKNITSKVENGNLIVESGVATPVSDKKADIQKTRQEELEKLNFGEDAKLRLEAAKKIGEERYFKELKNQAGKLEKGNELLDRYKAEDILANPNSTLAERITAKAHLQNPRYAMNDAEVTTVQRYIDEELSTVGKGEGKPYWNDTIRELKKIYDSELAALESKSAKQAPDTKIETEIELTDEEYDMFYTEDESIPYPELESLYTGPKFILTDDESQYVNEENVNEKAIRVSELKPEFKADSKRSKFWTDRGNVTDFLLRRFFQGRITKDNINMAADVYIKIQTAEGRFQKKSNFDAGFFDKLFDNFQEIKKEFDAKGYEVISNLPTLYGKLGDKLYAGTTDLLVRDKDGNFFIMDIKTSSGNRRTSYNDEILGTATTNYRESDLIQLNAYRELLKQRTGIDVKGLFIIPIQIDEIVGTRNASFKNTSLSKFNDSYIMTVDSSKTILEILPDRFKTEKPKKTFPIADSLIGKIIYISPGAGKTKLILDYPDTFVDMDVLIADELSKIIDGVNSENIAQKIQEYINKEDSSEWRDQAFLDINKVYSNAFKQAREYNKEGKTVLTGSRRFIKGIKNAENNYADIAFALESDKDIAKQLKEKQPGVTKEKLQEQVAAIRDAEKGAKVFLQVSKKNLIDLLQGKYDFQKYIALANSNREIMILDNIIPSTIDAETMKLFAEKKKLMNDRKAMYNNLAEGDVVSVATADGKNVYDLIVEKSENIKGNKQPIFVKNKYNIKSITPIDSYRIIDVVKNGKQMETPPISKKADEDGKDNLSDISDKVKDEINNLISDDSMENYDRNNLFEDSEDKFNCENN